jgi:hypothetical protein
MTEQIHWLRETCDGRWARLGEALRAGLPVPEGFVVQPGAGEEAVRSAYEELKVREHTHFVAVRGPDHALLDVIGGDALTHTLHRIWTESPQSPILIQCMVNGSWCGKASWEAKNLRVRASEGLRCLDPDLYLYNTTTNKCTRRTLYQQPRKAFRAVDGRTRTMEITGERRPLDLKYLEAIADLAKHGAGEITWVLDHRRVWLLSIIRDSKTVEN